MTVDVWDYIFLNATMPKSTPIPKVIKYITLYYNVYRIKKKFYYEIQVFFSAP